MAKVRLHTNQIQFSIHKIICNNCCYFFFDADLAGCGFENKIEYHGQTVAVSQVMYENGRTCGACFEMKCNGNSSCLSKTIRVTAAASCNPAYLNGTRNWCMRPNKHFELPMSIFSSISEDIGAVVPVQYRRVKCDREGGIKFRLAGSGGIVGALVYSVAGTGDVVDLQIKGSGTEWIGMINGDDQRWFTPERVDLSGQSLSFRVKSSDGNVADSIDIAPKNWKIGDVYEGKQF